MTTDPDALWNARDRLRAQLERHTSQGGGDMVEVGRTNLEKVLDAATWFAPDEQWPSATTCLAFMQRMLRDQEPADARRIVTWLADEFENDDDAA